MAPTAKEMADVLDEHLPYEVLMLLVMHDLLHPKRPLSQGDLNVLIESFCIHARNLFEFFIFTKIGTKNYAIAKAYLPNFAAFQDPQARAAKNRLYGKICEQISHLTFNRVKDSPNYGTEEEIEVVKKGSAN